MSRSIKQVLFSEGTYQIEVIESPVQKVDAPLELKAKQADEEDTTPGVVNRGKGKKIPLREKSFWCFLQMDDRGVVADAFCSCSDQEGRGNQAPLRCVHLDMAYAQIFTTQKSVGSSSLPLHVRFRYSLWNTLCLIASRRHGYDTTALVEEKGGYVAFSLKGKRLFSVRPLQKEAQDYLEELIYHRPIETEGNSLKFSQLSAEELRLWKLGTPSVALQYALSFWSDLAKWWMLLQEQGETYSWELTPSQESLPQDLIIRFAEVEIYFYLASVNWKEIIPTLSGVDSPLVVHLHSQLPSKEEEVWEWEEGLSLEQITYQADTRVLFLEKRACRWDMRGAFAVGEWIYAPCHGFFPRSLDPLLQGECIPEEKISLFLQRYGDVVQKYLTGATVQTKPIQAQYRLFFPPESIDGLHMECYAFTPGDLSHASSGFISFGTQAWVYLERLERGFYLLEGIVFPAVHRTIPLEELSDFIRKERVWLERYEGFQTHISSIGSYLTYHLNQEKELCFEVRTELQEGSRDLIDIGDWIYVRGRGFYPKLDREKRVFLQKGMKIPPEEISAFISRYQEELLSIPGFFAPEEKRLKGSASQNFSSGVHIFLSKRGDVVVRPQYSFSASLEKDRGEPFSGEEVFGDWVFIPQKGFLRISSQNQLPRPYAQERVFPAAQRSFFVMHELEGLRPYALSIDPHLRFPKKLALEVRDIVRQKEEGKEEQWQLDCVYKTEWGEVSPYEVWQALQKGEDYFFSPAGLLLLDSIRFKGWKQLSSANWSKEGKQVTLSFLEWSRLAAFEEIQLAPDLPQKTLFSLEEIRSFAPELEPDLTGLKSSLRPYQQAGVRWLWFLYSHGLSGLLCDEMGLGKTHQAMGLLISVINHLPTKAKYLVVCPTSVLYHWQNLLETFLPQVKVYVYYGEQKEMGDFQREFDLLLTSYGTFRLEKKKEKNPFKGIEFQVAIFDELQIAKNSASQTHRSLRTIRAKMRIGLTGTPIENRLLELKALFDLVLPGYLPQNATFKEIFTRSLEKEEERALLARFIRPFILRRCKQEVLTDLPEKIEEISYCFLSDEQKELYHKVFYARREEVWRELKDPAAPSGPLHVFALLSLLKQICDHPCLLFKHASYVHHRSGKWDLFVELLQEALESNQKVVIFSQYLKMLDNIEEYLKEKKIGFARLRGSTRKRHIPIERFQQDPQCKVFVASLQAAGIGIDLVAASVVIHYDRWWNPAKENQATDRVHRIGQTRGVHVFKLVTKGTIEEHIHQLIEKKKQLIERALGFDEELKTLSREELIDLMVKIEQDLERGEWR